MRPLVFKAVVVKVPKCCFLAYGRGLSEKGSLGQKFMRHNMGLCRMLWAGAGVKFPAPFGWA